MTFIPTASIPEDYKGYVDHDRQAFERLGLMVDELNIADTSRQEIEDTLNKNDYIFISGGNTFYLLQELRYSGADKMIIDQINQALGMVDYYPLPHYTNEPFKAAAEENLIDSLEGFDDDVEFELGGEFGAFLFGHGDSFGTICTVLRNQL